MKRIEICLIIMLLVTLNLTFAGGTNRWVSDGTESVLTPDYYLFGVSEVTAIPWGDVTTPAFNRSIRNDGAVKQSLTAFVANLFRFEQIIIF